MPMKLDVLNRMYSEGVVAILRADSPRGLLDAAAAIRDGGLSMIEVTMTTPGALDIITQASAQIGNISVIGAGSVLDAETARLAILAGARFLVTPALDIGVIRMANRYSVAVIMGCYTASEVKTAWEQGADLIKLFPATQGGVETLKALRAPFPQVSFVPTGGIDLTNAGDYFKAGAFAVGIGSALINSELLNAGNTAEITRRARAFRDIAAARQG